ncbi:MAG: SEC-C metal-binding domain-containing protein [Archangium sp.]|nr:SEC-C metal-binding domain-containing protein [Archangium sp.]
MVFSVDHESKKVIATILHDGRIEQYECIISACQNPVCTCGSVHLELIPRLDKNEDDRSMHPHRVGIDITEKILIHQGKFRTPIEYLDFAKSFLSTLDENDYGFLHRMHFDFKNIITESTGVDSIDAYFDYGQVERDGLMSAYNDVLPYGDQILVTIDDKQCIVMDQFCLLPKCSCTDTTLSIMPIDGVGKIGAELCSFSLNYRKKQWKELEKYSSSLSAKTLRSAIEAQIPDIYERLLARHVRLKGIYAHCKKVHFESKQPSGIPRVGRNDPCPCGSGKKYKKCCLAKAN